MSAGSGHDRRRHRAQHRPRISLGPLAVGAVGPQPPGRPPGVLRRGSRCATTIWRGTASWRPAAHRHRRNLDRPLGDQGMTRQRQGAVAALRHQPSRRLHRDHPDIGDVRVSRGSADCLYLRLGHLGLLQHPHADRQQADHHDRVPHQGSDSNSTWTSSADSRSCHDRTRQGVTLRTTAFFLGPMPRLSYTSALGCWTSWQPNGLFLNESWSRHGPPSAGSNLVPDAPGEVPCPAG